MPPKPESYSEFDPTKIDLRDYFAAKAMQSLLSIDDFYEDEIAELAYKMADAMLEARKR